MRQVFLERRAPAAGAAPRPHPFGTAPTFARMRTIHVARAVCHGETTLGAFDAALVATGIANFNLLRLSSVVPPETDVVPLDGPVRGIPGAWGDRLYVVMAEQRVDRAGDQAWAGIGWVQQERTGKGLFVEHEGHSEGRIRSDIEGSLGNLVASRPGVQFGPVRSVVTGGVCDGRPMCALVVAVYESEPWSVDLRGTN